MFELDSDTQLHEAAPGVFRTTLTPRWNIGQVPNGGYQLAACARALREATGRPHPLSVTGHFLRRSAAGPCHIETEVVSQGKRTSVAMARLVQGDEERLRVLATCGDLSGSAGPTAHPVEAVPVPAVDECFAIPFVDGLTPEILRRFELRFDPRTIGWVTGKPSAEAELRGWIRFEDGRAPDLLALLLVCDVFPPSIFASRGFVPWVPTMTLTVNLRAEPAAGWLLGRFVTHEVRDGLLEEDGWIWDSAGRLVATSRQLARILPRS